MSKNVLNFLKLIKHTNLILKIFAGTLQSPFQKIPRKKRFFVTFTQEYA